MMKYVLHMYKAACAKYGLLEDDVIWHNTLEEASAFRAPLRLRQLFAIMIITCSILDPLKLWDTIKNSMGEDFFHKIQHQDPHEKIAYSQPTYI